MRTAHSLTVSPSMLWAGGSARGGLVPGGESGPGGVSQYALRQTPPLTESQTPVKTLPCPNFVAGGKYYEWGEVKARTVNLSHD